MVIMEVNLKDFRAMALKFNNDYYIVINENLDIGEKESLINCLQTHIELNKFDFKLIGNEIIESEVVK